MSKAILIIDIPEAFEEDLRKGKLRSEFNVFNDEELIEDVKVKKLRELPRIIGDTTYNNLHDAINETVKNNAYLLKTLNSVLRDIYRYLDKKDEILGGEDE